MLITALVLLALAALGGVTMAAMHFRGKTPPPVSFAVLHGVVAGAALVVLLLAVWPSLGGLAGWALGLFVLAALGGLVLALGFHWRGKALPSGFVAGHGLLAVVAFVILLFAVF